MPTRLLSPECQLVFSTAGATSNDETIAALAHGPMDWARVIVLAEREKANTRVWRVLERVAPGAVPAELADRFRMSAMISEFKMLHLEQRFRATLSALHAARVETMLLKGAALGVSIYPSFVSRPMSDVDLLIHPDDVTRARTAILGAGWRDQADPVLTELLVGHHHLPTFVDAEATGIRLELHTALLRQGHPFRELESESWQMAVPASEAYSHALVPTPAHLLIYACIHFCWSHVMQFGAWRTFRDVNQMLSVSKIDWEELVQFAGRSNAASACYWTLRLAHRFTGTPVPPAIMRQLQPPGMEPVFRGLERHFVVGIALGEGPGCPSATLSRTIWRLAMRPRWSGYGGSVPGAGIQNWELAMTGGSADSTSKRVLRHVTGARNWWKYVSQTLI